MARGSAVDVPQTCDHGQVTRVEIEGRHQFTNLLAIYHLGAPAEVFIDLSALTERAHCGIGVRQGQLAALGVHDVEVEFVGQAFEHPHRLGVETHTFAGKVVGADHGGIARGVAAAQIALFQHRNVCDAVVLR
ncbi:hypothetical protein D3C87_1807030 [compost metagenome]